MHYLEALWDLFHTHIHKFLTVPHTLQCSWRERSWELRRLHFAVCCALFILMYTWDWCRDSMSVKPLWGLKSFPDKVAAHGPTCPVTGKCPFSYIKTVSNKPASACLSLPGAETVCVGGVLSSCMACRMNPHFTHSEGTHAAVGWTVMSNMKFGGVTFIWICCVLWCIYDMEDCMSLRTRIVLAFYIKHQVHLKCIHAQLCLTFFFWSI